MKAKLSKIFALLIILTMIVSPVAAQTVPETSDPPPSTQIENEYNFEPVDDVEVVATFNSRVVGEKKGAIAPATYIVQLKDAPVASYQGGVSGLTATYAQTRGAVKLDVNSPESVAYAQYLATQQDSFISDMAEVVGRSNVDVKFQYKYAFNGMAVVLTPQEAAQVAKMPNVLLVQREQVHQPTTDVSPEFLGVDGIWDGSSTGGLPGTKGEGVVIGILDTGINFNSPSFAEVGPIDGYTHINPYGSGTFVGWCNPTHPDYDASYACNDKLIGAWDFVDEPGGEDDGPWDHHSHGSHTASTSGGNVVTTTVTAPTTSYQPTLAGMAPHANIIAYDVCDNGGCPNAGSISAIDQAVIDGVDVLNYSIGGGSSDPWEDTVAIAFLGAIDAGVIVATSAGNDGPDPGTMGSPGDAPWMMTVGNSTHNRAFKNYLEGMSGGDTTPPADIRGKGLTSGYGPASIVYAGDYPNSNDPTGDPAQCLEPYPAGTFSGEIVVCDRGSIARVDKGANVLAGGAGGFVLANVDSQGESTNGDGHYLPGVHIGDTAGDALRAWLASGSGHMATISSYTLDITGYDADIMAAGSSRGPAAALSDIVKPDVAAPGTDILAAYKDGTNYDLMSGTSMASPHVAGAAALLRALYPNWSVTEIQSALMTTAWTDMLKEDYANPAIPFDMGSGRIDMNFAALAGLVLDETKANFDAADPKIGGDPTSLNIASFAENQCLQDCEWTRVVSSTLATSVDWTAAITAPTGMTVTVTPSNFTLAPFAQQTITVTADVKGLPADVWAYASFTLEPSQAGVPDAKFPIAVLPSAGVFPASVEQDTARNAGSVMLEDLEAVEITDLTVENFGLVSQTENKFWLYEVPDNQMDFPDIFFQPGVQIIELTVASGDIRLVAEINDTTSPDLDMLVLYDSNNNGIPELSDFDVNACQSASGGSMEACDILDPVAGRWFVMVLNFTQTSTPPDEVTLYTAVVPDVDVGNMTVTGPTSVPEVTPFDLQLTWDIPGMMVGDRYYGAFSLGTDSGNPGNIATIPVTLERVVDDVAKTANASVAMPGDTVTYTISVNPNVLPADLSYMITDTLPAGVTFVPNSITTSKGTAGFQSGVITWTLDMPVPIKNYEMTTSWTDPNCDTGFGGYVDLEGFNIFPISDITGDSTVWTAFATANPVNFYGVEYDRVGFTDDGYAIFDYANNWGGDVFVPQVIPDPALSNNVAAMLWMDYEIVYDEALNHGVSLATAGPNVRIIEYDDVPYHPFYGVPGTWDFEVVIRSLNDAPGAYEFVFAYDNLSPFSYYVTSGVENSDGTLANAYLYPGINPNGNLEDGDMICFDYVAFGANIETLTYAVHINNSVSEGDTITNAVEHQTDNPGSKVATTSYDLMIENISVEISPSQTITDVFPAAVVDYTVTVTNTGDIADTFDLLITGNDWVTTLAGSVGLLPGESIDVPVQVTVPGNAINMTDVTNITVVSQKRPAATDSTTLTTTTVKYGAFMPLIHK